MNKILHVINFNFSIPKDIDESCIVNTTSRSKNWSQGLSPFYLGPVELYNGFISQNVENGWQYSKVYDYYSDNGEPGERYFKWAQDGWNAKKAERYPIGRGIKPLYSFWNGKKLDYITARKEIYIPLYSNAVIKTDAFKKLKDLYDNSETLYLQDFDAHSLKPGTFTYDELWNNDKIKVGHGYVLAMMLESLI